MRPRNGPPEAVRTIESTVSRGRPSRHWKTALCSRVDRQQQASSPLLRAQRELAGGDEALLVREGERDPALQRPQRGADAGEADDGVEDDVRLGRLEQPSQLAADLDVLDGMGGREPGEVGRARRERTELEARLPLDDCDRLGADRPGCAKQRDSLHGHSVRTRTAYP